MAMIMMACTVRGAARLLKPYHDVFPLAVDEAVSLSRPMAVGSTPQSTIREGAPKLYIIV
jgi:hypothetical protein